MSKLVMPENLTETQEAQWWFDHQDDLVAEFQASREADNPEVSVAARRFQLSSTLDISAEDSRLARKQAEQQGLDLYQYTAQVLHEALLERELKKAS